MASKDPTSARFATNLISVIDENELYQHVNLTFEYVVSIDNDGMIVSQNGEPEVIGDKWELCAMANSPNGYLAFVACMSRNYQRIDVDSDLMANCSMQAGLDYAVLANCVEEDGDRLLKQSANITAHRALNKFPILYLNGEMYYGSMSKQALFNALCLTGEHSNSIFTSWWLYSIVGGAAIACCLALFLILFTGYGVYLQCHNVTDKWLNMIKNNPGNALGFAEQVSDSIRLGGTGSTNTAEGDGEDLESSSLLGSSRSSGHFGLSTAWTVPASINQHSDSSSQESSPSDLDST